MHRGVYVVCVDHLIRLRGGDSVRSRQRTAHVQDKLRCYPSCDVVWQVCIPLLIIMLLMAVLTFYVIQNDEFCTW